MAARRWSGCSSSSRQAGGELLACPFCVNARRLDPDGFVANARVAGGTPMFDWLGDEGGQIFSY